MKSKLTKLIIFMTVMVIFVIGVTIVVKEILKNDNEYKQVADLNEYYEVEACVKKFYSNYNELFMTEDDIDYGSMGKQEDGNVQIDYLAISETIYSLLDKEYIEFSGMTAENLKSKLGEKDYTSYIQIDSINRIKKQDQTSLYYVKTVLVNNKEEKYENLDLLLKKSNNLNTFSVYLSDYITHMGYNNLVLGQKTKVKLKQVESNYANKYDTKDISEALYVEDIFDDYKKRSLYNRKSAYSLLDEDLKKEKFNTYEKYDAYVKKNIINIIKAKFKGYNVSNQGDKVIYSCIDSNGSKYTFKVENPMQYKVVIESN